MRKLFTVRKVLTLGLFISVIFATYSAYYKIKYWGFGVEPDKTSDVWIIDAHISFKPTGEPINISLASPNMGEEFKILNEDIIASGYTIAHNSQNNRIELSTAPKTKKQNIYYRVSIYDNEDSRGKVREEAIIKPVPPIYNAQQKDMVEEIIRAAEHIEGNWVKKIITIFKRR